ncbi:hypothetical protein [Arthrobacter sp. 4R501]|uniref:hypothetical protein n=1 Tax=Arthrobacter sp. 4R501 TaxID=2058886 RepID=UPI000CE47175|nr:hypothetical protein [Arthrobacter sp. 4R501]
MTEVTGWEDLSGLLPESRGWMHSGVGVLSDGRVLCAHPEGHDLLVIDPSGGAETISTSLTEMHSIVTCERDGEEVIAVADPGHRFVEDPADASAYADHFSPGRAVILNRDGSVLLELECPPLLDYALESWRPTSIAVDDSRYTGSGDIWVADGYGASLVHRFDASGRYLGTQDGAETGTAFACPHGIMLRTDHGRLEIYVADRTNRRIVVMDPNGMQPRILGEGVLDSPSSLVLVGDRIYVTELFGGVARFDGHAFTRVLEQTRPRSNEDDAWPNRRTPGGLDGPVVDPGFFNSPHGIATDGHWLYVTEWFIGGRLSRLSLTQY